MSDPIEFPVPAHLRQFAHEGIEQAVAELPADAQQAYRRLLAEESRLGFLNGQPRPAVRAMSRLFDERAMGLL